MNGRVLFEFQIMWGTQNFSLISYPTPEKQVGKHNVKKDIDSSCIIQLS